MNKTIHYCWFGGEMPELAKRCIDSWRKYCPDYELKLWNESNFDVTQNVYIQEAYDNKKYAFVADYARLQALSQEGGVYLDTDVELVRSLDEVLGYACVFGFEDDGMVSTGVIGAHEGNEFIGHLLDVYATRTFLRADGSMDTTTNVATITAELDKIGLQRDSGKSQQLGNVTILPRVYFGAKDHQTGRVERTAETIAIHHYAGSWLTSGQRLKLRILHAVGPAGAKMILKAKRIIGGTKR